MGIIIYLLKTFSNKIEVTLKYDTKCPLFKSLTYCSQYSALNAQYFNTARVPKQFYVIFNRHMPPLKKLTKHQKKKKILVGMEFCKSGAG